MVCSLSTDCYDADGYNKCIKSCGSDCANCTPEFVGEKSIWKCTGSECVNMYADTSSDCQRIYGDPPGGKWIALDGLCSNMGCDNDTDCTGNFGECMKCSDNVCKNKTCSGSSECPEGYSCINGLCGIPDPTSMTYSVILIIVLLIIIVILAIITYYIYTKIRDARSE